MARYRLLNWDGCDCCVALRLSYFLPLASRYCYGRSGRIFSNLERLERKVTA